MIGHPFHLWLPIEDDFLHLLVISLLQEGLSGSSVSAYVSAIGTFCVWLNQPRPRTELVNYLIKGGSTDRGPPDKVRVHLFPLEAAVQHLESVVASSGPVPRAQRL